MDITKAVKFSRFYHIKPFFVKPCYNGFMGRNHFSRAGGPYFINNGFSKHTHSHDDPHDIKPDRALLLSLLVGIPIWLITIYAIVIAL